MIESIGTALLIVLGLASTFALRLGWLGPDPGHRRAGRSVVVEHGDLIASVEGTRHGRNELTAEVGSLPRGRHPLWRSMVRTRGHAPRYPQTTICRRPNRSAIDVLCNGSRSFTSLITTVDDAASLEVGLIGNEGLRGASLALGAHTPGLQAVVQGAGSAPYLDARSFVRACAGSRSLERVMGRYACFQLGQRAQVATCTRFHQLEARLARWLLMTLDRTHGNEFYLTHELPGMMLGVRRVGITEAASELQRRRLVGFSRGNVTVLNRDGLEAVSCSCYEADQQSYAQIISR